MPVDSGDFLALEAEVAKLGAAVRELVDAINGGRQQGLWELVRSALAGVERCEAEARDCGARAEALRVEVRETAARVATLEAARAPTTGQHPRVEPGDTLDVNLAEGTVRGRGRDVRAVVVLLLVAFLSGGAGGHLREWLREWLAAPAMHTSAPPSAHKENAP